MKSMPEEEKKERIKQEKSKPGHTGWLETNRKYARGREISKKKVSRGIPDGVKLTRSMPVEEKKERIKQEISKPGHTRQRETNEKYARGRKISKKKASRGIPDGGKLMKSMPEEEK